MTDEFGVRLGDLLPDEYDDVEKAIEGDLRGNGNKRSLLAWEFIRTTAARSFKQKLDYDAFRPVVHCWGKAAELLQYAKQPPGETAVVELGKHRVPYTKHPVLVLDFGMPPHARVQFTLEVAAEFKSVLLEIRNGHIVSAKPGTTTFSAQLKYKDKNLHKLQPKEVAIPGLYRFEEPGIRIGIRPAIPVAELDALADDVIKAGMKGIDASDLPNDPGLFTARVALLDRLSTSIAAPEWHWEEKLPAEARALCEERLLPLAKEHGVDANELVSRRMKRYRNEWVQSAVIDGMQSRHV